MYICSLGQFGLGGGTIHNKAESVIREVTRKLI